MRGSEETRRRIGECGNEKQVEEHVYE